MQVLAFGLPDAAIERVYADLIDPWMQKKIQSANRGRFENVPYGVYKVRVQARGFYSKEITVTLHQPVLKLRTQLQVGGGCQSGIASLTGTLSPPRPGHNVWVKLVQVRGSVGTEAEVNASGAFHASGLENGQYLIVVMDDIKPIYSGVILVVGETKVRLDLSIASKPALDVSR